MCDPVNVNFRVLLLAVAIALPQAQAVVIASGNGVDGMTALTDIVLFRLASDPGFSDLTVRSAPMVSSDDLIMIGNGRNRQVATTHWDVTVMAGPDNDIWTEVTPPADHTGFKSNSTKTIR